MHTDKLIPNESTSYALPENVERLLHYCSELGASDIFMQTGEPVRINLNGKKVRITRRDLNRDDVMNVINTSRYAQNSESILGEGKALNYAYSLQMTRESEAIRLRCNAIKINGSSAYNLVARTINAIPPRPETLGIEKMILDISEVYTKGMILFCGATGTGKSTSLASLIRYLLEKEDRDHHFIDIGAPIEYLMQGFDRFNSIVTPISIPDSLPSFRVAIEEALRMAPTMIQVTEMRDTPTLLAGLTAANTGHLLFSTLHTNSTVLAIKRMLDLMPKEKANSGPMDIVENTNLIVAQTLVPTVDNKRCAIREILPIDNDSKDMLYSSNNLMRDISTVLNEKGRPMSLDIKEKYEEGRISRETRDRMLANYSKVQLDIKSV
ncbi:type IV pilus twitching motility protein PilT [Aeromonas sp. 23P]|uniref:type IV pilus twitching motility protein PilT n=1 Tax=Aeromonas sp. 23P TaxID=3452716 RepID=UPI003F7A6045|nr:Flp pilus assembly complex ATPase component TadA [Aeromonas veronii]